MELKVYKSDGTLTSETVKLNKDVFGLETPNDHLIHLDVLSYLAAQRQGTHLARNRAMVTGSQKKPYRQKGTGRARAGTVKSNIWRGGGKAFGPSPHKYNVGMNRKAKRVARRSALTYKARNNEIFILEDIKFDNSSTKAVINILKGLNISVDDGRTMIVIKEHSAELWNSAKNVKNMTLKPAGQVCTYDIMRQKRLIILKSAAELMNEAM